LHDLSDKVKVLFYKGLKEKRDEGTMTNELLLKIKFYHIKHNVR